MRARRSASIDEVFPRRRGPNGERLCRYCGEPCPGRRLSWCSDRCSDLANAVCSPSIARALVAERDHGVCARCGLRAGDLEEAVREFVRAEYWNPIGWHYIRATGYADAVYRKADRNPYELYGPKLARAWLNEVGLSTFLSRSTWEAHHIHAVRDGGGLCGLDNYETLCWRCHPRATRDQNQRRKGVLTLPMEGAGDAVPGS